jgi:hypothetical protein
VARVGKVRHSVRAHAVRELDRQCVTASGPTAQAVRGPASGGRQRAANSDGCDDEGADVKQKSARRRWLGD